jgi:hypothetical protein
MKNFIEQFNIEKLGEIGSIRKAGKFAMAI